MIFNSYEKVNPGHPDKIADRIAGALVDYCYKKDKNPKCAFEVLIGHGLATIIGETSVHIPDGFVKKTVNRIVNEPSSKISIKYIEVPQDPNLAANQSEEIRCGDNGIFKGSRNTVEEDMLAHFTKRMWERFNHDGKYIIGKTGYDSYELIVCQSNATETEIREIINECFSNVKITAIINPLGEWTGSINVDSGATNRKLGSDMGEGVTGGGLMGKDLSKADVTINILCNLYAQWRSEPVYCTCAIGDTDITLNNNKDWEENMSYCKAVAQARQYIKNIGGFEKFAEYGLIR